MNNQAGMMSKGNSTGQMKEKIPSGFKKATLQQMTPEQMQLLSQLFPFLGEGSDLQRLAGGDQSMFEEMEAPAWRQFQEAQGELGSRFSSMGMGAQKGSGFKNAANQQSSDFAMSLQSKRQELQRQALKDLFEMSHQLMGERPYENALVQKPQKGASGIGKVGGSILGGTAGFFTEGPTGVIPGAQAGSEIFSGF